MQKILTSFLTSFALLLAIAAHADTPSYIGQHTSTPEDQAAIAKVVEQFRTAIINKNVLQLNTLMLNSQVLFSSAASPQGIRSTREKIDPNFDGVFGGGLMDFGQFLMREKGAVEEKFYNIKITQDDHMAWVMFDYEFQMEHKTTNYGIETWQLIKDAGDQWKIISVVWSVNVMKN